MKRFFFSLFLLIAVSCGKNGLYIHMDNTMWEITNEEQSGWLSFPDGEHVSLLQINHEEKAYRTMNGTYTVDGHRVIMSMDDNVIKATRTFSHLKNSSNKNYRKPSPLAPKKLKGSLWVGLKERNLRFIYFSDDSVCKEGHFENVSHKEGFPYGWSWKQVNFSAAGSQLQIDGEDAVFYESFLRFNSTLIPMVSSLEEETTPSTSSLKGTVWTYETKSYPGFIIFTSASEFTRVLVQSDVSFITLQGTYTLKGNSLEFKTDSKELNQICSISGGKFTYLERTYSKSPF